MSMKLMPHARCRTRTSPGPGSPIAASVSCIASGSPNRSIWIAFMGVTRTVHQACIVRCMLAVVTGGAGFIGSHTVDRLIGAGHHVVVLDDFRTGKRANLAQHAGSGKLDIVGCDVAHGIFSALAPVTARHGPVERIVHLAAQVSVVHSVANPLVDMQVNYGGTLHVLEYARGPAGRSRSSATAARPATSCTSATSCARSSRRPATARTAWSPTSARAA